MERQSEKREKENRHIKTKRDREREIDRKANRDGKRLNTVLNLLRYHHRDKLIYVVVLVRER